MAVSRGRCNLNKSLFFSCLQINRQKHSGKAICVMAIVELYSQKIQKFYPVSLGEKHLIIWNKI